MMRLPLISQPSSRPPRRTLVLLCLLLVSACGGGRVISSNPGADPKDFSSLGLQRVDFEFAAQKAVDEFLATDARFVGSGKAWVVQMGQVVNDTTAQVDTASLTSRIKNHLRKSGRFVFSAASGEDATSFVDDSRSWRNDPKFARDTLVADGNVQAARLEMSGAIRNRTLIDGYGKNQRLEYEFDLRVVDATTGLELFQSFTPIDKTGRNTNFSW